VRLRLRGEKQAAQLTAIKNDLLPRKVSAYKLTKLSYIVLDVCLCLSCVILHFERSYRRTAGDKTMKGEQTIQKFLVLRAQGKSLRTIEKELGTNRGTLAKWAARV